MNKPPWMMTKDELEMEARAREAKIADKKQGKSKKNLQKRNKENQERGSKGESLITDSLRPAGIWNHKLVNAGYGTVFDKLIIPPGRGYAIEVKTRANPRIEYSKIEPNERKGLDKFMKQVGMDNAFIIGIWLTDEVKRAFLIPWQAVRDQVCSGVPGSICMLEFPELQRKGSGWDLSCLWNEKGGKDHTAI